VSVVYRPAGGRRSQAPQLCRRCGKPTEGDGTVVQRFADSGALVWAEHAECHSGTVRDWLAPQPEWRLP
jgi:hypothetical protein